MTMRERTSNIALRKLILPVLTGRRIVAGPFWPIPGVELEHEHQRVYKLSPRATAECISLASALARSYFSNSLRILSGRHACPLDIQWKAAETSDSVTRVGVGSV